MDSVKDLKLNYKKLYKQDIEFFKKLEHNRNKNYIDNKKREFKKWYPIYKGEIEYIFKRIIDCLDDNQIVLNEDIENIYNDFVVFIFKYSY